MRYVPALFLLACGGALAMDAAAVMDTEGEESQAVPGHVASPRPVFLADDGDGPDHDQDEIPDVEDVDPVDVLADDHDHHEPGKADCPYGEVVYEGVCISENQVEMFEAAHHEGETEEEHAAHEMHEQVQVQKEYIEDIMDDVEETDEKIEAIIRVVEQRQEQGQSLLTDEEKEALRRECEEIERREQEQLQMQEQQASELFSLKKAEDTEATAAESE